MNGERPYPGGSPSTALFCCRLPRWRRRGPAGFDRDRPWLEPQFVAQNQEPAEQPGARSFDHDLFAFNRQLIQQPAEVAGQIGRCNGFQRGHLEFVKYDLIRFY